MIPEVAWIGVLVDTLPKWTVEFAIVTSLDTDNIAGLRCNIHFGLMRNPNMFGELGGCIKDSSAVQFTALDLRRRHVDI